MSDPATGDWFDALLAPGADQPAWYGKLLCLGDFAHRRLPSATVVLLDRWLASAMASSRAALGDAWLDAYLGSPLWHGVIGEQVIDERAWAVLLCPSVDAVGRYFPLVLLGGLPAWPMDERSRAQLQGWYAAVGAAALSTLDGARSLAQFEETLAQVPSLGAVAQSPVAALTPIAALAPSASAASAAASSASVAAGASGTDGAAWRTLTEAALARELRGRSAWWLATDVDPRPTPIAGLPGGADFAAMLRPG